MHRRPWRRAFHTAWQFRNAMCLQQPGLPARWQRHSFTATNLHPKQRNGEPNPQQDAHFSRSWCILSLHLYPAMQTASSNTNSTNVAKPDFANMSFGCSAATEGDRRRRQQPWKGNPPCGSTRHAAGLPWRQAQRRQVQRRWRRRECCCVRRRACASRQRRCGRGVAWRAGLLHRLTKEQHGGEGTILQAVKHQEAMGSQASNHLS